MPEHGLGREPHPETPRAASLYPVTERADYNLTTATRRYWWENGARLDQGAYGTCVGNAFAHRRANSPVPVAGIDETYARQLYLDASGDTTYEQGTSGLAACRVLAQRGTITAYHWIATPTELRTAVLTLGTVCVGTTWFNSMFTPVYRYGALFLDVNPASGVAGGHEYVITGINLAPSAGPPFYRMLNSWSTSWGHNGTARMVCADLEQLLFSDSGDAVLITESP